MAARSILRLGKVGMVTSLAGIPVSFIVYAADNDPCDPCDCSNRKIKINQLPLYKKKDGSGYSYQDEKVDGVRKIVQSARKTFCAFLVKFEKTVEPLKDTFSTGYHHTVGFIDYLQNDPAMLPRAAVITVAGLGGVIAGYRGGIIRKLFFASTSMGAAAAICYPKEAVSFSQATYCQAKYILEDAYSTYSKLSNENKSEGEGSKKVADSSAGEGKPSAQKMVLQGDLGQSNPGDKDMYTTRS